MVGLDKVENGAIEDKSLLENIIVIIFLNAVEGTKWRGDIQNLTVQEHFSRTNSATLSSDRMKLKNSKTQN